MNSTDFRLSAGSPAIDAGMDIGLVIPDFVGTSRSRDGNGDGIGRIDIGAFEY